MNKYLNLSTLTRLGYKILPILPNYTSPHTHAQQYIDKIAKTAQQSSKIDPKINVGSPTMKHPKLVQPKAVIRAKTPEIPTIAESKIPSPQRHTDATHKPNIPLIL